MSIISFRRQDESFPEIKQSSEHIIDFLLQKEELLEVFSDVLIGVNAYSLTKKIADSIMSYIGMYPEYEDDLKQLRSLMEDYYMYVDDVKFDKRLQEISRYYRKDHMYLPQKKLDKIRGILFETLVEKLIEKRYVNNFGCGCVVLFNGREVFSRYKGDIRKTIDVAGFDNVDKGEFYECKVTPDSLDEKSYQYLDVLEATLKSQNDITYIVGCVSAGTQLVLNARKNIIESNLGKYNSKISLFGLEDILNLRNKPSLFNMAV